MRLERISENQIRITLTGEDLAQRQIRLGELVYGSEKTKSLFREMMKQARLRFGFDAENMPLMIEAIPLGDSSITLMITKVEDPEELDTRFAKFSSPAKNDDAAEAIRDADDVLNMIPKTQGSKNHGETADGASSGSVDYTRLFRFRNIDRVIEAASALDSFYFGENTLYKGTGDLPYTLVLHKSAHSAEDFNKVCNILSEYAAAGSLSAAAEAHIREHEQTVFLTDALQSLSSLR